MNGRAATRFDLPYDECAPRYARMCLAVFLDRMHWVGSGDDASIVLGELVTNAIEHAHSGCTVSMSVSHGRLRLEVRDEGDAVVVHAVDDGTHRGKGLSIVSRVASMWGWDTFDDSKTVWAELAGDAGGSA